MTRILLSAIAFDAGTQIRAAIDPQVVSDYAEAMTNGATFPPIVLFHDGNQHYLADGFHRFLAAQRLTFKDIDADVRPGTKEDALWFALGANKTNGKRLTEKDKRNAIELALAVWGGEGGKSISLIAEQVGCALSYAQRVESEVTARGNLPQRDRVTGKDGKSYPASRTGEAGRGCVARTKTQRDERWTRASAMAAEGYTTSQIADEFGLAIEGVRVRLREHGIDVPADKIARSKSLKADRIVESIVLDAEHLTSDVNIIDFSTLHGERIGAWIDSLIASRRALDIFIKRLIKERQKHEEAA